MKTRSSRQQHRGFGITARSCKPCDRLDGQEQYSHRPCLVIEGIRSPENETEASLTNSIIEIMKSDLQLPDVTVNDVSKCHRIGATDNDGRQNIIIKFTKHSTATKVFRVRPKLNKLISWKKHVKFRTSLTRK